MILWSFDFFFYQAEDGIRYLTGTGVQPCALPISIMHPFFDVRRWMLAPAVLSQPAGGINIFLDGKSSTDPSTWKNYRYVRDTVQARAWDNKMYFMPIRLDELNRNGLLKQNPGY